MLYFIKGKAGSGKSAALRQKISTMVNSVDSENQLLLLVPEQFSFETERTMLKELGAQNNKKLETVSFKRLAMSVLKETDFQHKKIAYEGVRAALMSEALQQLQGRIKVFNGNKAGYSALNPLVELCKELKYCRISGEELNSKTELLEDGFLKEKLQDVYLINEAYDALVKQSYFDDTEAVEMLCDYARTNNLFENKTVFIDGFRAFSKQEAECFSIILNQAKDVCITLCMPEKVEKYSPFYFIREFENQLRAIANKNNVAVSEEFHKQGDSFSSDIYQLEKNIFSREKTAPVETDGSVIIAKCVDKYDECRFVASTIKKLIRSGEYRCRDIAIIERSEATYKSILTEELKALDVPVFEDSRRSLKYEALFVYFNALLNCLTQGLKTESILNYLKSGLSGLDVTEISRLEKYALVWNVGASAWREGFTMHPDGFGRELDDNAKALLDEINSVRQKVIGPLLKLKNECEDKTGKEITALLYQFLEKQKIQDRLYDLYKLLNEGGFPVEAERQAVSWDMLVSLLDEMAVLGDGKYMSLSRWLEIFTILVEAGEIGEIPQGLDEVKIGSADRIRTEKLKVVFLVGVNKDEFPLVSIKGGVLTDADRVCLTKLGLDIRPPYKDAVDEEYFIGYCSVTAASEKLYLSYKSVDSDGSELFPSEVIDVATEVIDNVKHISTTELDEIELAESDEQAFSVLAKNYNYNNSARSTLMMYFSNKPEFKGRLEALDKVTGEKSFKFDDTSVSQKLFRENMYLSASRIEVYYNCPFSYFLRYGLKAEPLRTAELDPAQSGTIVHLVMEEILQKYPKGDFICVDDSVLRGDVELVLDNYIEDKMGGKNSKSGRFMFLYTHLVETCMAIIARLKEEFSKGSFEPCGFEVEIGSDELPAYAVELEKGSVSIKGSIDRVDIMKKDGISYIRVIDYKTGKKEFKLSELFDGLNVQMVLYLMALEKNGKNIYGDFIPAGVLYLPSKIGLSDYLKSRSPKTEDILNQRIMCGKLSGMMLESLVVMNGMGAVDSPKYFPASYDTAKEKFTGNTYTQSQFRNLSKIIDSKIKAMGDSLHEGVVPAIPSGEKDEGKMCKYCSYRAVCGYETGDKIHEITKLSHSEALSMLGGDENEQNEMDT